MKTVTKHTSNIDLLLDLLALKKGRLAKGWETKSLLDTAAQRSQEGHSSRYFDLFHLLNQLP